MRKNPKFQNKHVGQDGWTRLRMRTCTWMKWSIIIAAVAPPAEKAKSAGSKVNFTMGPSGPGRVRSGMMRFLCGRKGHRFGLYLGANLDALTSAKERDSERGVVKERRPGPRNCTSVTTRTGWTHIAPPIERQLLAS